MALVRSFICFLTTSNSRFKGMVALYNCQSEERLHSWGCFGAGRSILCMVAFLVRGTTKRLEFVDGLSVGVTKASLSRCWY